MLTPYLNRPISGNTVYCATFQLAWNSLSDTYLNSDPIRLTQKLEMVDELNKRNFDKYYLDEQSYLALTGKVKDGIVNKIKKELIRKFRDSSKFQFPEDGIIAYAYMRKNIEYLEPLAVLDPAPFNETDTVKFFGTKEGHPQGRNHIRVLYYETLDDFAVSIKTKQKEHIVLARFSEQPSTLSEAISTVENSIKFVGRINQNDIVQIPVIDFEVEKEFEELADLFFLNPELAEYFISKAIQNVKFQLNEKGAKLRSEAVISVRKCSLSFEEEIKFMIFNKPFLVYMKRKPHTPAYFAAWINDTSILKS